MRKLILFIGVIACMLSACKTMYKIDSLKGLEEKEVIEKYGQPQETSTIALHKGSQLYEY